MADVADDTDDNTVRCRNMMVVFMYLSKSTFYLRIYTLKGFLWIMLSR